jgi:hypothetical protein
MTSTTSSETAHPTRGEAPSLAIAGQFIDGLADRDFDGVVATLAEDVRFRALLPGRVLDLDGRDAVRSAFDTWFGGAERWDLVEAVVGEVGGRIHLRWRLSVTNPQVAEGNLLVEQQVYADAGPDGRLNDVALLCTGYRPDHP